MDFFVSRMGGCPELRGPKNNWQRGMTIARFVCDCLPKVNTLLYDLGPTKAHRVVEALKTSKLDTAKDSNMATRREGYERAKTKNQSRINTLWAAQNAERRESINKAATKVKARTKR